MPYSGKRGGADLAGEQRKGVCGPPARLRIQPGKLRLQPPQMRHGSELLEEDGGEIPYLATNFLVEKRREKRQLSS